jgi:hypothetical protein
MSIPETVIVGVAIVAATVAAIVGSLTPELAGLLGVAVGYGGKGVIAARGSAGVINVPPNGGHRG